MRTCILAASLLVATLISSMAPAQVPPPPELGGQPTEPASALENFSVTARQESGQRAEVRVLKTAWESAPVLDKTITGVSPFNTTSAIAIIGRPSWSSLLDGVFDVTNKDGTFSATMSPALLWEAYPDWYLSGLKITASANTDQGTFTAGGRWDIDFTDPRFYFGRKQRRAEIENNLNTHFATCDGIHDPAITAANGALRAADLSAPAETASAQEKAAHAELRTAARTRWRLTIDDKTSCYDSALSKEVDAQLAKREDWVKARALSFSVNGAASYNSTTGAFGGANAALAGAWSWIQPFGIKRAKIPITLNASFEDATPKDVKDSSNVPRSKQAGGGIQIAYNHAFELAGGSRSVEVGGAFQALACLRQPCTNASSTLRLNPFVAVSLTDSIGGRIDLLWEGNGGDFRSAVAGLGFNYKFSGL